MVLWIPKNGYHPFRQKIYVPGLVGVFPAPPGDVELPENAPKVVEEEGGTQGLAPPKIEDMFGFPANALQLSSQKAEAVPEADLLPPPNIEAEPEVDPALPDTDDEDVVVVVAVPPNTDGEEIIEPKVKYYSI